MLTRLSTPRRIDDVFDDIVGGGEKPASQAAPAPPVAPPKDMSTEGGAKAKGRVPAAKPDRGGEIVRQAFNFKQEQLVRLEMLKACLYQKSGDPIDKSTLMREAMELLFKKYGDCLSA